MRSKKVLNSFIPYIQHIYELYNRKDNVENVHLPDEGHDYGMSKRKGAYQFLAKHLRLSLNEVMDSGGQLNENFINVEPADVLRVFNKANPIPLYAVNGNEEVSKLLKSVVK